jgi:hypothetical protein
MIRRFSFFVVLFFVSLMFVGDASAQFQFSKFGVPSLRHRHPMLSTSRMLPLAQKFVTLDTLDFGVIPQAVNLYYTLPITSSSSTIAYFEPEPWTDADYNGFEMYACTDDDNVDGSVEPNTTSKVYYSVDINPYWYQDKYPNGGQITSKYAFYYLDYDFTKIYEKDPAVLIADPLPLDTSGPPTMKLVHRMTQGFPMLLTDDTSGHTPVDIFNLDSSTQYFILENVEKDSIEITTAQCWGNDVFFGSVADRTLPFKLGPGEQVLGKVHFQPSTPETSVHPQTGQEVHFYYDEFVVATDATLGVTFASNATASGYKPSRTGDPDVVDWVHPDPIDRESSPVGSTYHLEWDLANPSNVDIDYSYHQSNGIPSWQTVVHDYAGTSYDWKLPDAKGLVDVRIVPVEQPSYPKIVNMSISASNAAVQSASAPSIQIYPNPVASKLFISGVHGDVSVLDLLGRTVLQSKAVAGKARFDCGALPVGNYLVRIGNEVRPVTIAH